MALLQSVLGAGPPGAYNIAADGVLTGADVVRELGLVPVPVPAGVLHASAGVVARLPVVPFAPPVTEWVEALSHPAIMDTAKAREVLGWLPRYTALEALRTMLS